jgi:hypothetical protein
MVGGKSVRTFYLFGILSFILVGCGKGPEPVINPVSPPITQPQQSGIPKQLVTDVMAYRPLTVATESTTTARIFLIAGGMDNANFAQEIVDQRALWLQAGFSESDISCYYTMPLAPQFEQDEAQYRSIAEVLKSCYPASPKLVWTHLSQAAKNSGADFLYLYVSSHGGEPLSVMSKSGKIDFPQKLKYRRIVEAIPDIDQYAVSLDVLPDGRTGNVMARMQDMYENKTPSKDHLFTPRYLKEALAEFNPEMPKFVTIQACHSGGFLNTEEKKFQPDTLTSLKNLTGITAARADRSSFGCDPGSDRTLFGEIYTKQLSAQLNDPRQIVWKDLFDKVSADVSEIEGRLNVKPSIPQFFTNWLKDAVDPTFFGDGL